MARTPPQVRCQGRSNCNACALRREMVCSEVSLESLIGFHAGIDDFDFEPGAELFSFDSPADAVYCLRIGAVKMVHLEPDGGVRIVRVLMAGDVAGLESVFRPSHGYSAIAIDQVRACRIPMPYFHGFIDGHPALQRRLMESSQAALTEAQNWLAQIVGGNTPVRTRLARLLLKLATGRDDRILRFPGEDMAAILGVTFETVSRVTSELNRQGILRKGQGATGRRYFHGDIAALEKIAAGELGSGRRATAKRKIQS
jgi:CRP-like cAMP-binding protein